MFDNKLLVNLYILSLDRNFELFIPVDEKIGNILKLLENSLSEYNLFTENTVLLNLYNGQIYNNNDIVRRVDIKNGTKLILI